MAIVRKDAPETAREDDYRDFEARDIEDGWPYADADGNAEKKTNAAYGQDTANIDTADNKGLEVTDDTEIRSAGGPALDKAATHEAIADDDLEEAIHDLLGQHAEIDETQITVTVHGGIAEISGSVETRHDSLLVNQIIAGMPGIQGTRNNLVLTGLDSHIPSDADDG